MRTCRSFKSQGTQSRQGCSLFVLYKKPGLPDGFDVSCHVHELFEYSRPVLANTTVEVLVGHKGPNPADLSRGLHGEVKIHVHVLEVHSRRHLGTVLPQRIVVIQFWPVVFAGKEVCGFLQWAQLRDVVEHEREDHLAREVDRFLLRQGPRRVEISPRRSHAIRGPSTGLAAAVDVDGFVEECVKHVGVDRDHGVEIFQELVGNVPRGRLEGVLEHEVDRLKALGRPEADAERL
mmetsp:Transcript_2375/g.5513  ORF Transcript_2375/g.5513 Transcript_2375/m.5513 type:complete len:234 (+) Transcript_2375:34-735(+)